MHKFLSAIFIYLFLSLSAFADDFSDGHAAAANGDHKTNRELRKLLAEQGDASAQYYLGNMYNDGQGVPEDDKEAVKWYRLAAEQGDANAQYNLGFMYDEGYGVPEDDKQAAKWYRLAAEQGLVIAQYNLGIMYSIGDGVPEDYVIAYMWMNLAAAQGFEGAAKIKKKYLTKAMTQKQIEKAQALSRECLKKEYKNCY